MLPSDLPWWSTVHRKLAAIQKASDLNAILEIMQNIHDLCNVSLDPDDDERDSTVFDGLRLFIENDLTEEERSRFLGTTIRNLAKQAQNIKALRPPRGLNFSLQQQADCVELDHNFVASVLANGFFSTFPKRTEKTHPTLQDFNFTNFFRSLDSNSQKAKLQCFLHYFEWIETQTSFESHVKIYRKVMTGKQWLTIEDWTECNLALCPLDIKHQGRIENALDDTVQTIFTSARIGGKVLYGGNSQECITLCTTPEAMISLLFMEALEDNEALFIEGIYQIARIIDPKNKALVEILSKPRAVSICAIDAENYSILPIDQFEEDNILRELNKCLLAYKQNINNVILENREKRLSKEINGRLSPIGESGGSSPRGDVMTSIVIKQPSTATMKSSSDSGHMADDIDQRRSWLKPIDNGPVLSERRSSSVVSGPTASGRRGRFIILGSSGECLPVNRDVVCQQTNSSAYSSCDSDPDEFHSAKESFDESSEESDNAAEKLNKELDTPEKRKVFVERLKEALRQSSTYTESTDSSYAVGISISGSQNCDDAVRIRRGGSTGFVLKEDSLDEDFYKESLEHEKEWLNNFRNKQQQQQHLPRKDTSESSKFSFSTEYSSELEEIYDQFSKWLDKSSTQTEKKELDPRDEAVMLFANSLLKRTLSESFVGVPLTDGCVSGSGLSAEATSLQQYKQKKKNLALNARSLSMELAKYKHRLAAQLISQLGQKHGRRSSSLRPIATGNWGCGSTGMGDVQLKLVIQWMAASVAGLPVLVYYTAGHEMLTKLDTVTRVLLDRKWTVGELASATLLHAQDVLENTDHSKVDTQFFFEKLIGI